MKINIIPSNKLALLCTAFCAAAMLAFSPNASADATLGFFPDTHVVGTVSPGAPADPNDVVNYVNFMITLAPGTAQDHTFPAPPPNNTQHVTRSTNLFGSLPTATVTGHDGTGTSVDLMGGTFTYLFAKYDGPNDSSVVWNIAGITGTITIPANGPSGYGLSGWILFGPGGTPPGVPDGGTTVMLLGAALGTLGMARRYIMS